MFRKILIALVAIVALAAAPASAQYPEIVVTPPKVKPGGMVTVTGRACAPGSTVTITLRRHVADGANRIPAAASVAGGFSRPVASQRALFTDGQVVATVVANKQGHFIAKFRMPADAEPGFYDVISECDGLVRSKTIEVVGNNAVVPPGNGGTPGGGTNSGNLPTTGSNLNGLGLLGVALLTIGGLALLAARKRSNATA